MGDSTTAELVVEEVEEKEKSGDENPKKADAEKKLVKEKTKLTEKRAWSGPVKNKGGATPKNVKNVVTSKNRWTNWNNGYNRKK